MTVGYALNCLATSGDTDKGATVELIGEDVAALAGDSAIANFKGRPRIAAGDLVHAATTRNCDR